MYTSSGTVRAPVIGRHQFFGTSEHYGRAHGSLLSGWINYNYTVCRWFPTSSNILILLSQFWQIRFESYWLHCSKCRILVFLRYIVLHVCPLYVFTSVCVCNHLQMGTETLNHKFNQGPHARICWNFFSSGGINECHKKKMFANLHEKCQLKATTHYTIFTQFLFGSDRRKEQNCEFSHK